MYYSHGDTVIYRSTEQRLGQPPRGRQAPRRRREPVPEASLSDRIARLEARIAELEEELAVGRMGGGRRPTAPLVGETGARNMPQVPESIKVSLHAGNGAHATVGQVRVEHD